MNMASFSWITGCFDIQSLKTNNVTNEVYELKLKCVQRWHEINQVSGIIHVWMIAGWKQWHYFFLSVLLESTKQALMHFGCKSMKGTRCHNVADYLPPEMKIKWTFSSIYIFNVCRHVCSFASHTLNASVYLSTEGK